MPPPDGYAFGKDRQRCPRLPLRHSPRCLASALSRPLHSLCRTPINGVCSISCGAARASVTRQLACREAACLSRKQVCVVSYRGRNPPSAKPAHHARTASNGAPRTSWVPPASPWLWTRVLWDTSCNLSSGRGTPFTSTGTVPKVHCWRSKRPLTYSRRSVSAANGVQCIHTRASRSLADACWQQVTAENILSQRVIWE